MTPEFRAGLFQLSASDLFLDGDGDAESKRPRPRVVVRELQMLFARLMVASERSISTQALTRAFKWDEGVVYQQHDVCELNRILVDALEMSLTSTAGEHLIPSLYRGTHAQNFWLLLFICSC